jgi:Transposase DDE domain
MDACETFGLRNILSPISATLDAAEFQRRFIAWVAKLIGVSADVIAIDGKTSRGSSHKRGGKAAIHMVSAFAALQRLVLGQVKVADKSNEIVAIPALLDMLAVEGAVVTIDAIAIGLRTRWRPVSGQVPPSPRTSRGDGF